MRFAMVNCTDIEKRIEELETCKCQLINQTWDTELLLGKKKIRSDREFISSLDLNSTNKVVFPTFYGFFCFTLLWRLLLFS